MRIVVTADGSKSLFSEEFSETYHSERGALTESRMLFLQASGIADRLADNAPTNAVELGFGTGLNFFLAADVALTHATPFMFTSFEKSLPPANLLRELQYEEILTHPEILTEYLAWREELALESGVVEFTHGTVTLRLVLGNMVETIPATDLGEVHSVLLDAFSPRTNPEPWEPDLLQHLANACVSGGIVVTFTVAGAVRRALQKVGFGIEKLPGPAEGKKEVLRGVKS